MKWNILWWEEYTKVSLEKNPAVTFVVDINDKSKDCDHILLNGGIHFICSTNHKNKWLAVEKEPLKINENPEKIVSDYITCPYCGEEDGDSFEADDSNAEEICEHCTGVFSYHMRTFAMPDDFWVEYHCSPLRKPDIKPIKPTIIEEV